MTAPYLQEITETQTRWATAGQRVLLLARRVISDSGNLNKEFLQSSEAVDVILKEYTRDLIVVGMIGISDPPRPEIPEVVRICRGGGIRFFMVFISIMQLTSRSPGTTPRLQKPLQGRSVS